MITFGRVGECPAPVVYVVEGYSPGDGLAHGSLDVVVHACEGCMASVRAGLDDRGMTPYSVRAESKRLCGEMTMFG